MSIYQTHILTYNTSKPKANENQSFKNLLEIKFLCLNIGKINQLGPNSSQLAIKLDLTDCIN